MTRFAGLIVAGGMILGAASTADAQFSLSIGNPYTGGLVLGNPGYAGYGYGYGSPYGYGTYGTTYVAPGTTFYSSGYRGFAAPYSGYGYRTYATPYSGYGYRTYSYPAYGYRNYGFGRRYGGWGWRRGLFR